MNSKKLAELRSEAEAKLKKKLVFSDGSPDTKIMLIGEAPGRFEEEQGKPFVGSAGKVLDKALQAAGLSRRDVYITNVVLWRPPSNRKPKKEEVEACKPFLLGQINIVKPKVICTLGNTPLEFFVRDKKVTSVRGKEKIVRIDGLELLVFPTFHPAAILYNRNLEKLFFRDIKKLRKMLAKKK